MRTSENRFSSYEGLYRGADGVTRPTKVYCYESTNALYDVMLIAGLKLVRTNCGPLSNMISDWKPHHYKIESHFTI